MIDSLTERQRRELIYHADFAKMHKEMHGQPHTKINYAVVTQTKRRTWWNQSWAMYDELLKHNLAGKRVLMPGCGFGYDCFRLAKIGAKPYGFDLSLDLLQICRQTATDEGMDIDFRQLPAEKLDYPENFFDAILIHDVLHHVEIPQAMSELVRVAKPGALVVLNEIYTHSMLDRIRYSWLVRDVLYKRMVRIVYGDGKPYITEDERKMNEHDIALVLNYLEPRPRRRFFDMLINRVLPPSKWKTICMLDYIAINFPLKLVASYLGGRIILTGVIAKS